MGEEKERDGHRFFLNSGSGRVPGERVSRRSLRTSPVKSYKVERRAGRMTAAPVGARRLLLRCQLGCGVSARFVARICARPVRVRSGGVRPSGRARGCLRGADAAANGRRVMEQEGAAATDSELMDVRVRHALHFISEGLRRHLALEEMTRRNSTPCESLRTPGDVRRLHHHTG